MKTSISVGPVVMLVSLSLASLGHPSWGFLVAAGSVAFQAIQQSRVGASPSPERVLDTPTQEVGLVHLSGLRVLVAEDVAINQRLLGLLLNRLGCQTQLASNGQEALNILEKIPIDVVLLDINMPGMDGVECLKRIRAKRSSLGWPEPKVVMTTSTALEHYRERCLESGADEFLSKPIRLEQLRAVLSKVSFQAKRPLTPGQDSLLDRQTLLELQNCAEPGFLASILEEACQDLPILFRDLRSRFESKDWSETLLLAHALKGSAATVGASRASRLAGELEAAARQNASERCQVLLEQLQPCLDETFKEFQILSKSSAETLK